MPHDRHTRAIGCRSQPTDETSIGLSVKESAVVRGLARGRAPKQVAADHGVTLATIRCHIRSAKRKTNARTLAQLVASARRYPSLIPGVATDALTPRQLEVVALLAHGLRYSEIANELSISCRQVQRLTMQAVKRAGAATVCEVVALAIAATSAEPGEDRGLRG